MTGDKRLTYAGATEPGLNGRGSDTGNTPGAASVGDRAGGSVLATITEVLGGDIDDATTAAAAALDTAWSTYHDTASSMVLSAAALAARWHHGQRRLSGEAYLSHPLAVAALVADLGFDDESVAAACCHDLLEDTDLDRGVLVEATNETVALLVDALTKVDRARDMTHRRATAASLLKLVVCVAGDVRALAVKLADRLHNVRTIDALPPERQRRIAHETLDVFSPLAHRLGMETVRFELEDRCFAVLYPAEHDALVASLRGIDLESQAQATAALLRDALEQAGIDAEVSARSKHLWSVYTKQRRTGIDAGGLHDMIGVRVIVDDVLECYRALGVVHSVLPPIPGKFKDYIAQPKPNGYQSLHTMIVGQQREAEIQIRTRPMHVAAAHGIAAHYRYKGGAAIAHVAPDRAKPDLAVMADVAMADPDELYALLREELAPEGQVIVLTPKGDTVTLPAGSTAIDFAYKIHTDIGNSCIGARINGVLRPLSAPLRTGDIVDIARARDARPSREWVGIARTARARDQIRRYLSSLTAEPAGDDLPGAHGGASADGNTPTTEPADSHPAPDDKAATEARREATVDLAGSEATAALLDRSPAVMIARCCWPTSPDEVGAQMAGGTLVIHRVDCSNYRTDNSATPRWNPERADRHVVEVRSGDRPGLLRDLTETLSALSVNLGSVESLVGSGLEVCSTFTLDVVDDAHLDIVCARLAGVPGVYCVRAHHM